MRTSKVKQAWVAGLTAGLTVVALGACSNDPPNGFKTIQQGRLEVSVLEHLEPGHAQVGDYWDVALQDEAADEDAKYRFVASGDFPDKTAVLALSQLRLFSALGTPDESGGFSQVLDGEDSEMWRWDFTYNDGDYQVVVWAISDEPSGLVSVVGLTGAGELDEDTIGTIESSIRILPAES